MKAKFACLEDGIPACEEAVARNQQEADPGSLADPTFGVLFCITGRFYVGQNLYISYTKGSTPNGKQDWATAVQAWYDEVADFSKDSVSPFQCVPLASSDRFTLNLVWP
jgi:hypothetical protein